MAEVIARALLKTQLVSIRDVLCEGRCRHHSEEESTSAVHMVFPYRGIYVRHLGADDAVAEANQVLFFNATEGYRVSHPVPGGDACLSLVISEALLNKRLIAASRQDNMSNLSLPRATNATGDQHRGQPMSDRVLFSLGGLSIAMAIAVVTLMVWGM
jgi:hypothetical protein